MLFRSRSVIPDGSTVYLNLQTDKINVFTDDGTKNLIKGV